MDTYEKLSAWIDNRPTQLEGRAGPAVAKLVTGVAADIAVDLENGNYQDDNEAYFALHRQLVGELEELLQHTRETLAQLGVTRPAFSLRVGGATFDVDSLTGVAVTIDLMSDRMLAEALHLTLTHEGLIADTLDGGEIVGSKTIFWDDLEELGGLG